MINILQDNKIDDITLVNVSKKKPPFTPPAHNKDVISLISRKFDFFQEVVQKTILHIQKLKMLDILSVGEVSKCVNSLYDLCKTLKELNENLDKIPVDNILTKTQDINNELSSILKLYGTDALDDLLSICFGNTLSIKWKEHDKFLLVKKYFHPISYSVLQNETNSSQKEEINNNIFVSGTMYSFGCHDVYLSVKQFHLKTFGIKINVYHPQLKKTLSIVGILDDVIVEFLNNSYITSQKNLILSNIPNDSVFYSEEFSKFISSLTIKDYLIYHDCRDIYHKYNGYLHEVKNLKQKTMQQMVKDYITCDLFNKRLILIQLLIHSNNYDNQYLAYMLYDILSDDNNGSVDTVEQTILFDSFPWSIKQCFRNAMKMTVQYTNKLCEIDSNKIPLEQQICLMNAPDNVKEKAMTKLKETKAKSEDSGSKAHQYLKGILKIPFGIFKKEKILTVMDEIKKEFKHFISNKNNSLKIIQKENFTSLEIVNYLKNIKQTYAPDKKILIEQAKQINVTIKNGKLTFPKIKLSSKTSSELYEEIKNFFKIYGSDNIEELDTNSSAHLLKNDPILKIQTNFSLINSYMKTVKNVLDKSVHGHKKSKVQIERIIGQWINGKQDGYCFGFEGPPGVGKTSLAKFGLANCLKDENGESRPFAMIQMGGDSNGSSLHGHNYTYVGSTWGSIVQILIDKKCMNPIIFIDELDKISKTENGCEIIGILIHLLDPAQNDCFQDKYFTGIDLDLSKALFVLSYNDAETVDRILLDRIHRVKFSNLSLEEKITISKDYLLPEIYKKMGLEGVLSFDETVIKFIVDEYTMEPGVRKLKEILFEIVGEINLDILTTQSDEYLVDASALPIQITVNDVKTKYFKEKHATKYKQIHIEPVVGTINGLWANALGVGGIIPIQVKYFPSEKFMDLKLTGMQGDVMKESMNVSETLAWNLTKLERQKELSNLLSNNGIHVHCPEGAVPKDGPSAGAAITTVIYSLFNERKIKNKTAITGEISLDGTITEIGGLDIKILGGLKAGVKEFIFPEENKKDFDNFAEKYKDSDLIEGIQFHSVKHINEVFEIIFF